MNIILIDFKSKQCKDDQHSICSNKWNGFGFEVICNCSCHKKGEVLDEGKSPSNITKLPSIRSSNNV